MRPLRTPSKPRKFPQQAAQRVHRRTVPRPATAAPKQVAKVAAALMVERRAVVVHTVELPVLQAAVVPKRVPRAQQVVVAPRAELRVAAVPRVARRAPAVQQAR